MSKTIDFIFDFASPNAYLSHRALAGVLSRTGAEVHYIPCLLGGIFKATGNQAPMMAFANIKGKMEYEGIETKRFIAKHDIKDYTFNPHFPINTLMMMRGAIAAQKLERFDDYLKAGLHYMWEDPRKMDDEAVFVSAFDEAGFDGKALLEMTQKDEIKAELIANTQEAVERGVFGIPTFFVDGEIFFGKERLGQLEEELML